MKFDAIVFDMDGLLVDSEPTWLVAEKALIERRGDRYEDAVREKIIGLRTDDAMRIFREHFGWDEPIDELSDELHRLMVDLIEEHARPLPGSHEIIEYVERQNIPAALATSSVHALIDAVMNVTGWGDFFKLRASGEDVVNGKPAPDVYLRAVEMLDMLPGQCLALEDSPTGAKAATSAGLTCYAVPDPSHSEPGAFEGITPHRFDSLHEVLALLKQ